MVLAVSLFAGCAHFESIEYSQEISEENPETIEAFDQFINDIFETEVTENTINLHFTISDPEKYGITDYPVTLGDLSNDAMSDSNARLENYLSGLSSFSYTELTLNQQLTYDILENYFQLQLDMADMYLYDELLRPSTGVQAQLPILYEEYSFNSKKDVEDYLKLLALTDEYFDQIISFEKEKADAGLFMSDFACQNIIDQCNAFIADSDNHYLIETFNTRIDKLTGLTQSEKDHYRLQNEKILHEHIFPAYENLVAALTDLLGSGTNENGLCYFPEGKQYYEYLLAYNTGTSESVKTLENMISNERVKVLQESSDLTTENPELWELASEATLTPTDSVTTLNHLKEVMLDDFPAPPEIGYTVNYIDDCVADYLAPAFYVIAPIDDYSHNSIYINETTDTTNISYFTTLAHEGFPGHLYQTVMTYESGIEPVRSILNYSGFVEGWATYVEFQSYHYAGLDDDVATILELNQDATLSLYASTDIGIHYEGWTLEDTKKFWNNYGITNDDAIESIFELIVEEPTHYLKYYIGFLKFEELKKETSLKNIKNYNDKSFHQAVLSIGPAPFDIVDKYLPVYYEYIE
ncbi:MAG: DUF885 domain-containing protein [Roseburia inulinivorans]|uniref:DUF885 domain-containing protein n=1 Tax=Roseburia inulinivorans TaxID=360807 RepID=A0A3R6AQZ6_9FIRM|nr:DUF885 domain-containing protein [Roseburia inulinivorans]RHA87242.1 DUF885 domain-containing protein [Roseburia inulinivorans]